MVSPSVAATLAEWRSWGQQEENRSTHVEVDSNQNRTEVYVSLGSSAVKFKVQRRMTLAPNEDEQAVLLRLIESLKQEYDNTRQIATESRSNTIDAAAQ